ncbi:MAG TPA: pantetheine-phosphate adenylyltransferase [Clostridia bacterium]
MKKAIYAGSFDPITNGHLDILTKACTVFDDVIVGVLSNPLKKYLFTLEERIGIIKSVTGHLENIEIKSFYGALVDFAEQEEAYTIIRGLRSVSDYEYELQLALTNRALNSKVETIFFIPDLGNQFVSSTIVREIARLGKDISQFVPTNIVDIICKKVKENS